MQINTSARLLVTLQMNCLVDAFVTPVFENGTLTGYQSVRTVLKENYRSRTESLYQKINSGTFNNELIKVRSYFAHQKNRYDSVSRHVFSEAGMTGIAEFANRMHERYLAKS